MAWTRLALSVDETREVLVSAGIRYGVIMDRCWVESPARIRYCDVVCELDFAEPNDWPGTAALACLATRSDYNCAATKM